jgi:hypothetical protein
MLTIAAFICGLIFGLGLLISGMVQPTKVLAFLDIFGTWDPSLAVVMLAALVVSGLGFCLANRRERPLLCEAVRLPNEDSCRSSAGGWLNVVRNWMGSRWIVPRTGFGEPCNPVTTGDRICHSNGRGDGAA